MNLGTLFAVLGIDSTEFEKGIKQAQASLNALSAGIDTVSTGLETMAAVAAASAVALSTALGAVVVSGVETAASMQQVQLGFEAMLGGASAATDEIAKLNAMAAATPFEFKDLVTGAQTLIRAGQSIGMTADGARAMLTAVGDAVSLMGGNAENIKSVDRALSQMMMKGKVQAEEMTQMAEAGFDPWQRLSAELGVSTAKAQKMVTAGLVPAAKMMQAVVNQPGKALGAMNAQSQTLIGMFSTLKDVVSQGLGKAAEPLVASLTKAMPAITAFTSGLVAAITPIFTIAAKAAEGLGLVLTAFSNLGPATQQTIVAVGIIGTFGVAALTSIAAAAFAVAPAVLSAAAAFLSLDAAMAPIIGVGALILAWAMVFVPIGAAIATVWVGALTAVGAAVAALASLWEADFLGMASVVSTVGQLVWTTFDNALALVANQFNWLAAKIEPWATLVKNAVTDAFHSAALAAIGALMGISPIWTSLVSTVIKGALSMGEAMTQAFSGAGVIGVLDSISGAFVDMSLSVLGTLSRMISAALPLLDKMGETPLAMQAQGAILSSMVAISDARGNIASQGADAVVAGATSMLTQVKDALRNILPADMLDSVTAAISDYRGALDGLTTDMEASSGKTKKAKADKAEAFDATATNVIPPDAGIAFLNDLGKSLASLLPKTQLSAFDEAANNAKAYAIGMGQAEADLAIALSRRVITEDQYNYGVAQIQATREQFEMDAMRKNAALVEELAAEEAAARSAAIQGVVSSIVDGSKQMLGTFGSAVSAVFEGFKSGGVKGAIAAGVMELLSLNKNFQGIVDTLDQMMIDMSTALNGLVQGLAPVISAIANIVSVVVGSLAPLFTVLGNVLVMIAPVFQVVAVAMQSLGTTISMIATMFEVVSPILYFALDVIYNVFRVVAEIILGVAFAIGTVWNAVIEAIAGVLDFLHLEKAAANLRSKEADTASMADAMNTLADTSYAQAVAQSQTATSATAASEALDGLTESLTNVPTGFKLEKYIYDAVDAQAVTYTGGASKASASAANNAHSSKRTGGGAVYNFGAVTVVAPDPASFLAQLEELANKRSVVMRASPVHSPTKWSTR